MNHYHLKIFKVYSVAILLAVLISFLAVFPLGVYAQQEDLNATVVKELVANEDKQPNEPVETTSESLLSEEPSPSFESAPTSETNDEAKQPDKDMGASTDKSLSPGNIPAPAEVDVNGARTLKSVDVKKSKNGLAVTIESDGLIKDYKSFTLKRRVSPKLPARIVFDILNMKSHYKTEHTIPVNTKWVSRIRHYASNDKIRIVLDTKNEFLNSFSSKPVSNGLLITIGTSELKKENMYSKIDAQEQPAEQVEAVKNIKKPAPISELDSVVSKKFHENNSKPAWVDKIDFTNDDAGKSTITIGTTKPVELNIKKVSNKLLHLQFSNTNIPTKQKRPIITTRFKSAVDGIWPIQTPKMGKTSIIAIELREEVPYTKEQSDNLIKVHFEASSVLPKPEERDAPAWKEVLDTIPKEAEKSEIKPPIDQQVVKITKDSSETKQKYTGEKISLDFYDTDIKNVFRILMEVSGKNFAIDKNVGGRVTLSLDKPVPWDQALDLILRMNQLGVIQEGNIVRISTLETIKREQELRKAGIIAEKKAMEQEKELEPLAVEYIPISYSNAKTDILPHLEKIQTKGRGNISVDERTNLIIMADVTDVIKKAKEIVKKLDKVTPQVVIEARIVEASANFSKEIGVSWGSAVGVQMSSLFPSQVNSAVGTANVASINNRVGDTSQQSGAGGIGGTYGLNTSINFPATSPNAGSLGFNFIRINGTPFLLNAKLQAMEAQGEGKIVSAPKISTLDNKEATIKQGLRYPYNKLDTSGNTTTVFEDVDLELKVKPHVTPDNRISMVVKIKKRDLGSVINSQQSFTTKEAETELLVNDGETVVIGGIIKTTKNKDNSAIPGLSRLPVFGWLFKSDVKTDNKEELLIFITPKIVTLEQII